MRAERPDAVVFNGYADQYDARPLAAQVGRAGADLGAGRRARTGPSSFHVVGGQFDTVYAEGAYLLQPGSRAAQPGAGPGAGQGGFVELAFPEAGHYPFVSHVMVDAERGAHGRFDVTG